MAFMTISRLASKRLLGAQFPLSKYNVPTMSAATANLQPSLPREGETYDTRNARLNRPMSPHLTIYKFEMSSTLSITHRITGLALAAYAMGLAGAAICPVDFNTICATIQAAHPGVVTIAIAKFTLAYPMMYHTCNGIRHLVWDTGNQISKKHIATTGTAMLVASILTTAIVMFM